MGPIFIVTLIMTQLYYLLSSIQAACQSVTDFITPFLLDTFSSHVYNAKSPFFPSKDPPNHSVSTVVLVFANIIQIIW